MRVKYDFGRLSDHNVFQDDPQVWLPALSRQENARSHELLDGHIEQKGIAFKTYVRLKTHAELRVQFEQRGRFLVIGGEEITLA